MKKQLIPCLVLAVFTVSIFSQAALAQQRPRIAVFSGPLATIQNSPPLVTSNKSRARHGLPLLTHPDGSAARFDHLVAQRLAAPVEVFIEQFSAHPLEQDAAQLYAPPDGFLDVNGTFHKQRQSPEDKPVYRVTLNPEDGPYLLPYMALQASGDPWDDDCASHGAPADQCRQPFYPDAARIFEEIDRGIGGKARSGMANELSSRAEFDFYRVVPSGGYKKGLAQADRTDVGSGDIPPEVLGEDFFPYTPDYFRREALQRDLAKVANQVQKALGSDAYAGAVWLESSPTVQDTTYWLNLLVDSRLPISGNAAQRAHGLVGNDGDRNIIDSVDYILSGVWADRQGRDEVGAVMVQDEQIFTARQVEKQDARPGGYRAAGDNGGVIGTTGEPGPVTLWFKPTTLHTWKSAVNLTRLPDRVQGVAKKGGRLTQDEVQIKDDQGWLRGEAIPKVTVVRYDPWAKDSPDSSPEEEVEILARMEKNLNEQPLAGFVMEGTTPYGNAKESMVQALELAALSGMPVVRVSRGDEGGMLEVIEGNLTIEGNNLVTAKARLLLIASLLKLGSLPPAADAENPTAQELKAVQEKIERYQEIFNTH